MGSLGSFRLRGFRETTQLPGGFEPAALPGWAQANIRSTYIDILRLKLSIIKAIKRELVKETNKRDVENDS